MVVFFCSSRRRHTRWTGDWSSDVCSSDLAELSGGMRKRVALARAIVREPKIVLYDEPTTGLDPLTTESVDEMIIGARQKLGVTSVVISHDIGSTFHIADHVAMLHSGRIVEEGPPDKVRHSQEPHTRHFLDDAAVV